MLPLMQAAWQIPHEFELPRGAELQQLAGTEMSAFNFAPPGPVAQSFIFCDDPIPYLMGPAGSGKTVSGIVKALVHTLRMPVCKDGVIRARLPIIRDNFRTLYRTTLPSIFRFFPKDFPGATFEGGQDRPFCFTLRFRTPAGKMVQLILDGFGVSDDRIEELLKGYEPCGGWLEEADLLAQNVKTWLFGRVAQGRYPGKSLLADPKAKIPRSVWGTLNPPLISHYVVDDFVNKPLGGHVLYRQPSGLSDQAENRAFTSREEYEAMAHTLRPDEVRRQVHGEFGLVGDGAIVYPEYDHSIHCARAPLAPLDLPLLIGVDAGGTPALILGQFTPKGHMRWLDEFAAPVGEGVMSVGRFAENIIDLLQSKYRGLPLSAGWGDPSAFFGADRQAGELTFMETLGKALNLNIMPTPTNEPHARQESVSWFLRRGRDGDGIPYFQHSPHMKIITGGFQGGFTIDLNKHNSATGIRFTKNKFSHPHEAGQYLCYGVRGHAGMINDAARAGRPGNIVPISHGVRARQDFNL